MNNDELIELYLGGKLPMDEAEAFEARLTNDLALQEEVRLYKLARTVIHLGIKERNKETFDALGAELLKKYPNKAAFDSLTLESSSEEQADKTKKNNGTITAPEAPVIPLNRQKSTSQLRYLRVAAVVLVLVVAFLAYRYINNAPALSGEKLIAEHVSIPRSENVKSPNPSTQPLLDSLSNMGVVHFQNEAYEKALEVYQARLNLSNQNSDRLYKGAALLKLGRYPEAIQVFRSGPKEGNLADQFQWHLIVAYKVSGDRTRFKDAMCDYEQFNAPNAEKTYFEKTTFLHLKKQENISCD